MSSPKPGIIVYTTPPLHPLPASDAESIYLVALFQLVCPGRWGLSTGDWSVNGGKLPYVTHLDRLVTTSQLKSLPSLEDPDERLSATDRGECLCWKAYIEGQLIDLVNHTLYSLPPNYPTLLGPALSTDLSWPQSSYIPQRIRGLIKERLQHVGLWGVGGLNTGDAWEEDQKRQNEAFVAGPGGTLAPRAWSGWRAGRELEERRRRFGEEERAKAVLDPLERRLGSGMYFFGDSPTTVDLFLFSQLALLLAPSWPNQLLPTLLKFSYPALVAHHDRVLSLLFGAVGWSHTALARLPAPPRKTIGIWDEVQSWFRASGAKEAEKSKQSEKDKSLRKGRWAWYATAIGSMAVYLIWSGLVTVEYVGLGGAEQDDEVEEDEAEELQEVIVLEVVDDEDDEAE
ncbi:hypothetical protein BCR39DRAFT_258419 [Naematelia encephala]|uniref:GST C-terminal domain-containing protein n=1 Tax=Naematelia encephala TaxID=71784 RepID=A0A1Y2AUU0_9TREE|nr:hypothetical protein BCR39DRAFT_258419 [Naematelia encephala]